MKESPLKFVQESKPDKDFIVSNLGLLISGNCFGGFEVTSSSGGGVSSLSPS